MIPDRPEWHTEAACRGMHDLFFGPNGERNDERIRREQVCAVICAACPVAGPCAEQSTNEVGGFWAGRSRENNRAKATPDCGTQAGYSRHRRWNEEPCEACEAEHAVAKAERPGDAFNAAADKARRAELWADAS